MSDSITSTHPSKTAVTASSERECTVGLANVPVSRRKVLRLESLIKELEVIHSLMDVCRNNDTLQTPEQLAIVDTLNVAQNRLFTVTRRHEKKLAKLKGGAV